MRMVSSYLAHYCYVEVKLLFDGNFNQKMKSSQKTGSLSQARLRRRIRISNSFTFLMAKRSSLFIP